MSLWPRRLNASWSRLLVYLDDVLVFSTNREEHNEHVREVLKRLRDAQLFAYPEKCRFGISEVTFLGRVIGGGKVRPDPEKIKSIKEMDRPKSKREVQRFLGMANYLRKHIKGFSALAIGHTGDVPLFEECHPALIPTEHRRHWCILP